MILDSTLLFWPPCTSVTISVTTVHSAVGKKDTSSRLRERIFRLNQAKMS